MTTAVNKVMRVEDGSGVTYVPETMSYGVLFLAQPTVAGSLTANRINLPCVAGFRLRIISTSTGDATGQWRIYGSYNSTPITNQSGHVIGVAGAVVGSAATARTFILRSAVAADTAAGDYVDVSCDGATMYYSAVSVGTAQGWSVSNSTS
jgi:hypothetical protein